MKQPVRTVTGTYFYDGHLVNTAPNHDTTANAAAAKKSDRSKANDVFL